MARKISSVLAELRDELRFEPVRQQVRVTRGGHLVAQTTDALLVWEPRSQIPAYAVPRSSITVPMTTAPYAVPDHPPAVISYEQRGRLHLDPGRTVSLTVGGELLTDVGYQFDDPDLSERVLLRWTAFDWDEEATRMLAHPQDPYVRVSTRRSDRHVQISYRGVELASSKNAVLLLETDLPPRWYLPREDLAHGLFEDSTTHTLCPYKGVASYLSLAGDKRGRDLAWCYPDPLPEAEPVRDLVAFWNERVAILVDGEEYP